MSHDNPGTGADQEQRDPEGNEEQTGRRPDPDRNFGDDSTVTPEDKPATRISEDADGNFGDDPTGEPEEGAGGTTPER
jgi:hypothetical protein